jgi:hypothetical protein
MREMKKLREKLEENFNRMSSERIPTKKKVLSSVNEKET